MSARPSACSSSSSVNSRSVMSRWSIPLGPDVHLAMQAPSRTERTPVQRRRSKLGIDRYGAGWILPATEGFARTGGWAMRVHRERDQARVVSPHRRCRHGTCKAAPARPRCRRRGCTDPLGNPPSRIGRRHPRRSPSRACQCQAPASRTQGTPRTSHASAVEDVSVATDDSPTDDSSHEVSASTEASEHRADRADISSALQLTTPEASSPTSHATTAPARESAK